MFGGFPPIRNVLVHFVGLVTDNYVLNELIEPKQKGAFTSYLTLPAFYRAIVNYASEDK